MPKRFPWKSHAAGTALRGALLAVALLGLPLGAQGEGAEDVATTDAQASELTSTPSLAEVATRLQAEVPDLPSPGPDVTNVTVYLASLAPRVLVSDGTASTASLIGRTNRYGERYGYVRVDGVASGLGDSLEAALGGLGAAGPLSGLVLDLRFAGGEDFESAADAAGRLATRPHAGLRLGPQAWPVPGRAAGAVPPVMVLINGQTRGAAEALAMAVRAVVPRSLLLGAPTAGEARLYRPFDLGGGLVVRVGGDALRLADSELVAASGLTPDVPIVVSEADERTYRTNEFRRITQNRSPRGRGSFPRLNEAELMRRHRNEPASAPSAEPGPATVQDPALGSALDLLEALAAKPEGERTGDKR